MTEKLPVPTVTLSEAEAKGVDKFLKWVHAETTRRRHVTKSNASALSTPRVWHELGVFLANATRKAPDWLASTSALLEQHAAGIVMKELTKRGELPHEQILRLIPSYADATRVCTLLGENAHLSVYYTRAAMLMWRHHWDLPRDNENAGQMITRFARI